VVLPVDHALGDPDQFSERAADNTSGVYDAACLRGAPFAQLPRAGRTVIMTNMTQPYIPPPTPSYPPKPPPPPVKPIPMSTTDTIPGHEGKVVSESLLISTTVGVAGRMPDGDWAASALAGKAHALGFDAVIGVRFEVASYVYGAGGPVLGGGTASREDTAMNVLAYGTALRWK
jgi:hypothetical protein